MKEKALGMGDHKGAEKEVREMKEKKKKKKRMGKGLGASWPRRTGKGVSKGLESCLCQGQRQGMRASTDGEAEGTLNIGTLSLIPQYNKSGTFP